MARARGGEEASREVARIEHWAARALKLLLEGLLSTALVAAVFLAALPSLLSTSLGCSAASAAASAVVPGRVHVAQIQLSWTGPTRIQGVSVIDSVPNVGDVELLRVAEVSSESSLTELLRGHSRRTLLVSGAEADMAPHASNNATPRLLEWAGNAQASPLLRRLSPSALPPVWRPELPRAAPHTDVASVPVSLQVLGPNLEVREGGLARRRGRGWEVREGARPV